MATLNYKIFASPGAKARSILLYSTQESMTRAFFPSFYSAKLLYSNARECKSSGRGARWLAAAH